MSLDSSSPGSADSRREGLAALAAHLGVELPLFDAPLVAFQLDGHRSTEDPVFLGGDLHATHPRAAGSTTTAAERDPSLDFATITLIDHDHPPLDVPATAGVWCTRVEGDRLAPAPYLSINDSDGRILIWLLLPPPRLMVGIAHHWLTRVPSLPGGRRA